MCTHLSLRPIDPRLCPPSLPASPRVLRAIKARHIYWGGGGKERGGGGINLRHEGGGGEADETEIRGFLGARTTHLSAAEHASSFIFRRDVPQAKRTTTRGVRKASGLLEKARVAGSRWSSGLRCRDQVRGSELVNARG